MKSFAFKLAEMAPVQGKESWRVRDGVAVAGCSGPDYRADRISPPGRDLGTWC